MEDIKSSEEIFGARLLQEVGESEESLESLLSTLHPPSPQTGIPELNTLLLQSHQPRLSISGRSLPLLLRILTRLLSAPTNKTVVLIDLASRFSVSWLDVHGSGSGSESKLKTTPAYLQAQCEESGKHAQECGGVFAVWRAWEWREGVWGDGGFWGGGGGYGCRGEGVGVGEAGGECRVEGVVEGGEGGSGGVWGGDECGGGCWEERGAMGGCGTEGVESGG
ncbi:Peptidase M43 pregnancy-associated plasma-A protein [Rutstroemia sp. NJR-2017a BBW]|nr:Peptidase M43 pregnancy-associated plasma-A protein [Rutstroemia sp. NJR-2017a BBW]